MIEADMVEYAQEKGLHDGCNSLPYSPPLQYGISIDTDDAYNCAYWFAIAYINT